MILIYGNMFMNWFLRFGFKKYCFVIKVDKRGGLERFDDSYVFFSFLLV